jgi:shikimate kinase/3-dehydroquinate synthase
MVQLVDNPIFLTGFMATGKTKVGRVLADRLGRGFVDTDDLIVEAAGKSIPEIFEADGEVVFRDLEHEAVRCASVTSNVVVSLGGGAITQERNWDVIRATGVCLCFRASVETIFKRVERKRDERPLLAGLDDEGLRAKIGMMLKDRAPFYDRADAFVTSMEDRTPEETAEMALTELRKVLV